MKKWQVTLKNGNVVVEATDLTITSSGALMFSVSGVVQHVFAHGHWADAVLLNGGRHGYR